MHNNIIQYLFDQQLQTDLNFHRLYHPNVDMIQSDHDIYKSNKRIVHLKIKYFIRRKKKF